MLNPLPKNTMSYVTIRFKCRPRQEGLLMVVENRMYTNKPEAIILCHRRGNITLLWPPYFRPVVSSFFLHSFLPSSFSFFPGLISTVANWMSTIPFTSCGLSTNLGCRSEMRCTRLAENIRRANRQNFPTCAALQKFVGLYLRN